MMHESHTAFPQDDRDPFQTQNMGNEINTTSSSWQSASNLTSMAPRWNLLTDQERQEHDGIIQKLESKLKKLEQNKDKPKPTYINEIIPDVSHHFAPSDDDSDGEGEEDHHQSVEEEGEGLPLLWKSRSMDLDHAPRKTEDQYNKTKWWCFACCW